MFDYLTKTLIIYCEFTEGIYWSNLLWTASMILVGNWELNSIAPTDGVELNFDKSFLYFDVKKKLYAKVTRNLTVNIE